MALARAFARTPRLVLLDEAFSAMDRDLRRELGAEVRAWVEAQRIPAILVTHHRMEARAMANRAVIIAGGRVQAQGPIHEVIPGLRARDPDEDPFDELDGTPMPQLVRS